mmetsp:Transcript_94521/g.237142  ORF Transcript_94521/g.237142 Transcript_94521/m.237142 type:complete len:237 (-) Transcript_94521:768-1478(-)
MPSLPPCRSKLSLKARRSVRSFASQWSWRGASWRLQVAVNPLLLAAGIGMRRTRCHHTHLGERPPAPAALSAAAAAAAPVAAQSKRSALPGRWGADWQFCGRRASRMPWPSQGWWWVKTQVKRSTSPARCLSSGRCTPSATFLMSRRTWWRSPSSRKPTGRAPSSSSKVRSVPHSTSLRVERCVLPLMARLSGPWVRTIALESAPCSSTRAVQPPSMSLARMRRSGPWKRMSSRKS